MFTELMVFHASLLWRAEMQHEQNIQAINGLVSLCEAKVTEAWECDLNTCTLGQILN